MSSHITKSGMDLIDKSPLDYYWAYINPNRLPYVPDKKTIFNKAFRCAVLDPVDFASKYVKCPPINRKTKAGQAEFDSLERTLVENNQIMLSNSEYTLIEEMKKAVLNHPNCKNLFDFSNGILGETRYFEEPKTGAPVSFDPHWIYKGNIIINLSTTDSADSESFQKDIANLKHHKRAAIGIVCLGVEEMIFVEVEIKSPHKIGIYVLDEKTIQYGRKNYIENCRVYLECLNSGEWPGYTETIQLISMPNWAFNNEYGNR